MQTAKDDTAREGPPLKPPTPKAHAVAPVVVPGKHASQHSVALLKEARVDVETLLKELGSRLGD
jgi:hypothetical protein